MTENHSPNRKFGIRGWILALLFMLSAGFLFYELAVGIKLEEGFAWDESVMLAVHSLSRPWLDTLFTAITHTADIWILIPLAITVVVLWRRSEKTTAALVVTSLAAGFILSTLFKVQYARPRPDVFPPLVVEHSYSFPSGHTMAAVSFYGLLAILLWQRGHRLLAVVAALWVLLVAFSRVYLGAHYPSDVLASLALGIILLFMIMIIDKRVNSSSAS